MNLESLKIGDMVEVGEFLAFSNEEVTFMVTKATKGASGETREFDATFHGIHIATVVATDCSDGIKWEVKK